MEVPLPDLSVPAMAADVAAAGAPGVPAPGVPGGAAGGGGIPVMMTPHGFGIIGIPGRPGQIYVPPEVQERAKKWTAVYPCYLNLDLSVEEGRRLPREKLTGCSHVEMADLLDAGMVLSRKLGRPLQFVPENKRHPRSDYRFSGRLRVRVKDDAGEAVHPELPTKAKLLEALAQVIPTLPGKAARAEARAKAQETMQARRRAGPGKSAKAAAKKAKKAAKKAGGAAAAGGGS